MSNTLKLEFPLMLDGGEVTALVMRRPTVGDHLVAEKATGGELDAEVVLFGRLCSMNPEDLQLMDMADYKGLQEIYKGFLSRKKME
ncbi:Phage tail assembly chaperone protein, E, or 41 or 14 [Humidesulfovibrio mexicanus]|uniref:Phage tail assembly chaperone protein, E, or 41 or 14 n=1 Tax=Humidesulfovibrio mexicanus TaxID=147047 RepID=A0A239C819_9BACT|nr:phage tail assembly protein [Humidesulfovibrio mexicanus]SNS16376.1 Phage tail assembly chaperone protein, E, or 41 or 14 [Humidesulfovibrio mexicanus]